MSKLLVFRLSSAEKSERLKKGLCWYCDEKCVPRHVCKHRFFAYMGDDDDDNGLDKGNAYDSDETLVTADISHLYSMDGCPRSKYIPLEGTF